MILKNQLIKLSVQCNTLLGMTGEIRGTNTEKLYQRLGLESLQNRCMLCGLYYFTKYPTPPYLHDRIPTISQSSYSLRATKENPLLG